MKPDLFQICRELNERSHDYAIGNLQHIRKRLNGLSRLPARKIFQLRGRAKTVSDKWAFHYGGRSELQFNIGFDGSGGSHLRYGVAFSFAPSQSMPAAKVLDILRPRVRLFNEFLALDPIPYGGMKMWQWSGPERIRSPYPHAPIADDEVRLGVFVFLGHRERIGAVNAEKILSSFDRLLPLYYYVQSGGQFNASTTSIQPRFTFQPGCPIKPQRTRATLAKSSLDVSLRHNVMQRKLYGLLVARHGEENVGAENATGSGTRVDLVVRHEDEYWFYEIKTAVSPRVCIREALGQLLEYSLWPGGQRASRLIVVGESPIDDEGREYLSRLSSSFSLPIEYEHVSI